MHETIPKPIVSDHFQLEITHPGDLRPNKIIYMIHWSVYLTHQIVHPYRTSSFWVSKTYYVFNIECMKLYKN